MKCPKCGTENRDEVRFCRHCGQRLVLDQPPTPSAEPTLVPTTPPNTVCGVCGAAVKATARFCPRCGKELRAPTSPPPPQQPVISTPAYSPGTTAGSANQLPSYAAPVFPTNQPPPQQLSYSPPIDPPPAKVRLPEQQTAFTGKNQKKRGTKKSTPGWVWGAIIGILVLVMILIVLATVFIPKALKGTGLLATDTATAVAVEQPSPTLTHTASPSPTIEPTPTPDATVESPPVTEISAASIILISTPETITVGSQVVVTVSLTNDSEGLILPLRCDLIGEFAPVLKLAESVTYTVNLPDTEPPLDPGATRMIVYRMDAIEPGTAILGASVLIEVNTPDHRQVVQSPIETLTVR